MTTFRLRAVRELQTVTALLALLEAEHPDRVSPPLDQARAALYAAKAALSAVVGPAPAGPSENID